MKVHSNEAVELGLTDTLGRFLAEDLQTHPLVYHEPVDEDREDDLVVEISHRQLLRLVFMAAETGVRFERDELSGDPVNWLLTPKKLFNGQAPVDACRHHDAFLQGIILHGLSLGVDADPNDMAELLADDDHSDHPTKAGAPLTVCSAELSPA